MKIKQSLLLAIGPLVFGLLAFVLYGPASLLKTLDWRINDSLMQAAPKIVADPRFVMLDIDDESVLKRGLWPWPRDTVADLILQFRENGAEYLTFDIEYIDPGVSGVNLEEKDSYIQEMKQTLVDIRSAVEQGILSPAEADDAMGVTVSDGVGKVIRDNDRYLGHAVKLFGKAFVTMNTELAVKDNQVAIDALKYSLENHGYGNVTGDFSLVPKVQDGLGRANIVTIAQNAPGAGFTNMEPDADGVTRRVFLLQQVGGKIFAQLTFRPLLDLWGNPPLEVSPDSVVIKRSAVQDQTLKAADVVVPLDTKGQFVINWLPGEYMGTFEHVAALDLFRQKSLEKSVSGTIQNLGDAGYLAYYQGGNFGSMPLEIAKLYRQALDQGDTMAWKDYLALKAEFKARVSDLLASSFVRDMTGEMEKIIADPALDDASKAQFKENLASFKGTMDYLATTWTQYSELCKELEKKTKGGFGVIGNTATSTTDLGVSPYVPKYENPGVHANVANTIVQGRFLDEAPAWMSTVIMLTSLLLMYLVQWRIKRTSVSIFAGFAIILVMTGGLGAIYMISGYFIGMIQPVLATVLSLIYLIVFKFYLNDKEKRFIRSAFASYLSPEVIKEIEKDPTKLVLGGEKRQMTAMFTDVKGFSTFSEKLDPNDLVKLLNEYLTGMAELILEKRGTIDKYEGDAIIAFWGAPETQPDHAMRAVHSAIRMRRLEAEMNPRLMKQGLAMSPLLTRFGINSGDMTVGNMGSANRMNYTAMGNAMNLAARLEGVNKQYGTWILTSEFTRNQVPEGVLFRGLDRVTVVGISTPVRLYEVVDFTADAPAKVNEAVALFEDGVKLYESRQWAKAVRQFNQVIALMPEDGPSSKFIERCKAFARNPPEEGWDGVYRVTVK